MRYVCKMTNHTTMTDTFSINLSDEYQEATTHLARIIRDPTILKPGGKSIVLLTPLNTGWEWIERKQNVRAVEVWSESNQVSEITKERFTKLKMIGYNFTTSQICH